MIRKEGKKWVLRSLTTGRSLGRYDTREEAEARERQVQFFKHLRKRLKRARRKRTSRRRGP